MPKLETGVRVQRNKLRHTARPAERSVFALSLCLAMLLYTLPPPAWAQCGPSCPSAPPGGVALRDSPNFSYVRASPFRSVDKFVLGAGLGYAFPTEPLKAQQVYVKLVPGIWKSTGEQDGYLAASTFQGVLLGGSVLYGVDDNWGLNLTGIWEESTRGSAETVEIWQNARDTRMRLSGQARGYIVAGGVVYDPIAGRRFRLPIVVGIGYNYYTATVEQTFNVANPGGSERFHYFGNHRVSRKSVYFGAAPQADFGGFRFVPFVITSDSAFFGGTGHSTVRLENLSTGVRGESKLAYGEVTYLSGGLTVKYLPWNLGLSYIRGDMLARGIDTDVYSLTWNKKW